MTSGEAPQQRSTYRGAALAILAHVLLVYGAFTVLALVFDFPEVLRRQPVLGKRRPGPRPGRPGRPGPTVAEEGEGDVTKEKVLAGIMAEKVVAVIRMKDAARP